MKMRPRFAGIGAVLTVVAGVGRMDFRIYAIYSAIGAVLWATGVTLAGYFLGNIPFVKDNIELILIGIVAVSVIPVAIEALRHRKESRAAAAADPAGRSAESGAEQR